MYLLVKINMQGRKTGRTDKRKKGPKITEKNIEETV